MSRNRWVDVSRRLLQGASAAVALATIALAALQVVFGVDSPVYDGLALAAVPALDSNMRFFGGMGLGLGLMLLWITPRVERHGTLFAVFWACAFLGGVGRALSWILIGAPPARFLAITLLELVGAPIFVLWQRRVARATAR